MRVSVRVNVKEELKAISREIARLGISHGFSAEEYLNTMLLLQITGATSFSGFTSELKDILDNSETLEEQDYAYMLNDLKENRSKYQNLFDHLCFIFECVMLDWIEPDDEIIDGLVVPPLMEIVVWRV